MGINHTFRMKRVIRSFFFNMAVGRSFSQVIYVMAFVYRHIHISCRSVRDIDLGGTWIVQNAGERISLHG